MAVYKLVTPEGTKDYLFSEADDRVKAAEALCRIFSSRGYRRAVTPVIEYLDVFLGEGMGVPIEYMYKLTDHEGRLMVLRPDSTTPIARLCATRLKDELPIRIFYSQPVCFSGKKMSGKSSEVLQSGIELIAPQSEKADLEALSLAVAALEDLSADFRLEIGHIGIFNSLMDRLRVTDEVREQVRQSIETKNYPALDNMLSGADEEISVLKQLPRLFGGSEVFEKARALIHDENTINIINYLEKIYAALKRFDAKGDISVDLGIVNRTDYYTGIVFRGYVEGYLGEEVLSGGRYDNLLGRFGKKAGAVGFGVNVDAATRLSAEKKADPPADSLVFAHSGCETVGLRLCAERSKTEKCEFSLALTFGEAIEYAKAKGIATIIEVGEKTVVRKAAEA